MKQKLTQILHPNRYFIWTIIFLVVFGPALIAYIHITTIELSNQSVFSDHNSKRTYTDRQMGFTVKYPGNWILERDSGGNVIFENPENTEEAIIVASASLDMEGIIRHSIEVEQETDVEHDGYEVSIIKATSIKDGTNLDVALVKTSKKLFYISGHSPSFVSFVNNFKPL